MCSASIVSVDGSSANIKAGITVCATNVVPSSTDSKMIMTSPWLSGDENKSLEPNSAPVTLASQI